MSMLNETDTNDIGYSKQFAMLLMHKTITI